MGRYIKDYMKYIEKILGGDDADVDYEKLRIDFLLKISFFDVARG